MSTMTKDETPGGHDQRFEDRLLDALLAEFDAPAEVRALPGPIRPTARRARQRAGSWLAAAAVVALLGGSAWVFTGGLDPDDTRVTVAGAPTTADPDPVYLLFPDDTTEPGGAATYRAVRPLDFGDPKLVGASFRPRVGGSDRPLLQVISDPARRSVGSGTRMTTPGGIVVTVPDAIVAAAGPLQYASWIDAEGRVLSVQQSISSYLSDHPLELVPTAEVLALVDRIRTDGKDITLSDPDFARADDDPNSMPPELSENWWTFTTRRVGSDGGELYLQLDGHVGAADLDLVPGERVPVRGVTGVLGVTADSNGTATALAWVEDGSTFKLAFSGPGSEHPSGDELIAAADQLRRVTSAEFDARNPEHPVRGGVRLDLPEGVDDSTPIYTQSLNEDGAPLFGSSVGYDAAYSVSGQRYLDLMLADGAAAIVVWRGVEARPACAQRIDVSGVSVAAPIRVALDPTCTG